MGSMIHIATLMLQKFENFGIVFIAWNRLILFQMVRQHYKKGVIGSALSTVFHFELLWEHLLAQWFMT
jgi:hypothetical protein